MKVRLFLAACFITLARADSEGEMPQFIRIVETPASTELQTVVLSYEKGGTTLDLIGAVHIADRAYYQELNRRFERYEALLYEGIGGGKPAAPPVAPPEPAPPAEAEERAAKAPRKVELGGLHAAYQAGSDWLGLTYQMQEIDYTRENFVHADVTLEEFARLQEERGETLAGFMFKVGLQPQKKGKTRQPSSLKLLASIVRKDKNGVKREFIHS